MTYGTYSEAAAFTTFFSDFVKQKQNDNCGQRARFSVLNTPKMLRPGPAWHTVLPRRSSWICGGGGANVNGKGGKRDRKIGI